MSLVEKVTGAIEEEIVEVMPLEKGQSMRGAWWIEPANLFPSPTQPVSNTLLLA
jgi:hypothetical protein